MVHVPLIDVNVGLSKSRLALLREKLSLTLESVKHLPHNFFHVVQLGSVFREKLLNANLQLFQIGYCLGGLLNQADKA